MRTVEWLEMVFTFIKPKLEKRNSGISLLWLGKPSVVVPICRNYDLTSANGCEWTWLVASLRMSRFIGKNIQQCQECLNFPKPIFMLFLQKRFRKGKLAPSTETVETTKRRMGRYLRRNWLWWNRWKREIIWLTENSEVYF